MQLRPAPPAFHAQPAGIDAPVPQVVRATGYLEERFHRAFEGELARLGALVDRLIWRERNPTLQSIEEAFVAFSEALHGHIGDHERDVHPRLRAGALLDEEELALVDASRMDVRERLERVRDELQRLLDGHDVVERALVAGMEHFRREVESYFTLQLALVVGRHRR